MLAVLPLIFLLALVQRVVMLLSVCTLGVWVGLSGVPKPRYSFRYKVQCWLSRKHVLCFGITFFFFFLP